jgi:chromate transport protein ChrA
VASGASADSLRYAVFFALWIYFLPIGCGTGSAPHHGNGLVRLGLAPVVVALVIASGTAIAHTEDNSWQAVAVAIAVAAITLATRLNPMWMLLAGEILGGLRLLK